MKGGKKGCVRKRSETGGCVVDVIVLAAHGPGPDPSSSIDRTLILLFLILIQLREGAPSSASPSLPIATDHCVHFTLSLPN